MAENEYVKKVKQTYKRGKKYVKQQWGKAKDSFMTMAQAAEGQFASVGSTATKIKKHYKKASEIE